MPYASLVLSWSIPLTTKTTKLRILLDENLPFDLAEAIKKNSSAFLAIKDMHPDLVGTEDSMMMQHANENDLIVITMDTGINEKTYPPCRHPGIIRLAARQKHKNADAFRRFMLSGIRKHVHHCITFVSRENARVVGHEGQTIYQF